MALTLALTPGTHIDGNKVARTFSEADLVQMARNYDPTRHRAPIVVGHDETKPNKGQIKAAYFSQGNLLLEDENLEPKFREDVNNGRYLKPSIGLYHPSDPHNPTPGEWSVRHLSVEQIGAVKGLPDLQFSEGETAPVLIEFSEAIRFDEGQTTATAEQSAVDSSSNADPLPTPPEPDPDDEPTLPGVAATVEEIVAHAGVDPDQAVVTQFSEADALAQRLAAIEAREQALNAREFIAFAEEHRGKIPGQKARAVALMQALAAQPNSTITFSEGANEVSGTALQQFQEFVQALPVSVEFREIAKPTAELPDEELAADFSSVRKSYEQPWRA